MSYNRKIENVQEIILNNQEIIEHYILVDLKNLLLIAKICSRTTRSFKTRKKEGGGGSIFFYIMP